MKVKDLIDAESTIADIEKQVDDFAKETQAILLNSGLSKAELKMFEDGIIPEETSQEMKECLHKMQQLKDLALYLKSISAKERGVVSDDYHKLQPFKKLSKREYRKKYRRLRESDDRKQI